MNVEIYIDGQLADYPNPQITFQLQANNLLDFDTREFSFAETIYLPTTPNNRQIFSFAEQLPTTDSGAYKKYKVDYYVNGVSITTNAQGFLLGKRGDVYLFAFYENSRDIYMSLIGKKIKDLPLDTLQHDKDFHTIKEQWQTQGDIIYAVADYGGETIKGDAYNLDYCPPSIKMDWILQRIKELKDPNNPYVFKSQFFDSPFWKSLYMSVSDVIAFSDNSYLITKYEYKRNKINGLDTFWALYGLDTQNNEVIREDAYVMGNFIGNFISTMVIKESGYYHIKLRAEKGGYMSENGIHDQYLYITKNAERVSEKIAFDYTYQEYNIQLFNPHEKNGFDKEFIIWFNKGDHLKIKTETYNKSTIVLGNFEIKISLKKQNAIKIQDLISDLPLIDWFREVTRLFSLTPIKTDRDNNIQEFYTLNERINAPVLDWSDKFIQIKEHKFHSQEYAQINNFTYAKYDPQSNAQDGNDYALHFKDEFLKPQKEFKSRFFLGIEDNFKSEHIGETLDTMEFYTKETKEKGGKITIEYKAKNNRFHIFQAVPKQLPTNYAIHDGNETQRTDTGLFANVQPLKRSELHEAYYKDFPLLMENLHLITCEFNLSELDIHTFSFHSRIYVENLGSYFLPNKITYKVGTPAIVELIKIK